jgi:hypothetical protein
VALEGLKALAAKPAAPAAEPANPKRASVLLAAGDLIAAVKSGDAEMVADALEASYDACSGGGGTSSMPMPMKGM